MELKYAIIFLLGFFSCMVLFYGFTFLNINNFVKFYREVPFGTGLVSLNENAPSDWISKDDIIILDDKIILQIPNTTLSSYANSGSMKPIFDEKANGIRIVPKNEKKINVGDIISYKLGDILIVHRVIKKGIDDEGVYFVVQGDNNILTDGKIRFKDIRYVTIGVIW